jgi:glutaredoxin-like protein
MGIIPEEHKPHIKEDLNKRMKENVKLIVFTQETECPYCKQNRELVEEIATLTNKIEVEVYDFLKNKDKATEYKIDKIPATIILGEKDYGIRFYGLPYGYEFKPFLETIINISNRDSKLPEKIKTQLKTITRPIHIQIFVTLTCPYCPLVTETALKFAMENDLIRVDVIDANEFLHLAHKYGVMGTPKTIINERTEFLGVLAEEQFLAQITAAQRPSEMYV